MSDKLNDRQKRFANEYLIDFNATQAAIRAGYSEKTANRIGSENLSKLDIAKYIEKRKKARINRTQINQDFVLVELLKIAMTNGTDFAQMQFLHFSRLPDRFFHSSKNRSDNFCCP